MFGSSQIDTDRYLRTMGWARVAQQEIQEINAEMKAYLEAYSDGVNAYLKEHQGNALSLEYAVLKFLNPGYKPEPWQILHSLTWGKVMAYDLGTNFQSEVERAIYLKPLLHSSRGTLSTLSSRLASDFTSVPKRENGEDENSDETQFTAFGIEEVIESITKPMIALEQLIGPTGIGIGSNNWVISGELTDTGKPILANDPHLGVQIPSIWYEVGLHCISKSAECPYNVTGFSFGE